MSVWFATVVVWVGLGHGAISSHQIGPFSTEDECKVAIKTVTSMNKYPSAVCYKGSK